MNYSLLKKLIEQGIVDHSKLILNNFRAMGLTEVEAFILIELFNQLLKGSTYLSTTKLGKQLSVSKDDLFTLLEGLIQRQYISIFLRKNKEGKDTEFFTLDGTLKRIVEQYEIQEQAEILDDKKTDQTPHEAVVNLIEDQFQKQLKPLEIELIQKWIEEDHFSLLDIRKALLDSVKAGKFSLSYVDSMLIKRRTKAKKSTDVTYHTEKSEALKTFFDSWDT